MINKVGTKKTDNKKATTKPETTKNTKSGVSAGVSDRIKKKILIAIKWAIKNSSAKKVGTPSSSNDDMTHVHFLVPRKAYAYYENLFNNNKILFAKRVQEDPNVALLYHTYEYTPYRPSYSCKRNILQITNVPFTVCPTYPSQTVNVHDIKKSINSDYIMMGGIDFFHDKNGQDSYTDSSGKIHRISFKLDINGSTHTLTQ